MRRTIYILGSLVLFASSSWAQTEPTQATSAAPIVNESELLGTWVVVHRSLGGLGTMITFLPSTQLEFAFGAIVEAWYLVDGDTLIEPPGSSVPGAKPDVWNFRVEGDTLIKRSNKREMKLTRVSKADTEAPPVVGVWRWSKPTIDAFFKQQKPGAATQAMAEVYSSAWHEYTRDGLIKFRLRMRVTKGTYDVATSSYTIVPENRSGSRSANPRGSFRIDNGLLVVTSPDGGKEQAYIRADATREKLKRAGVRYDSKEADLDPPSDLAKRIGH